MNRWGQPTLSTIDERSLAQAKVGPKAHNSSGFKGVFWNSQRSQWQVRLMVKYENKHVGFFTDLVEAAKAHRAAIITAWGDKVPVLTDEEIHEIAAHPKEVIKIDSSAEDLGL